jgi:tetratricopeptide (TPR) repeat protein
MSHPSSPPDVESAAAPVADERSHSSVTDNAARARPRAALATRTEGLPARARRTLQKIGQFIEQRQLDQADQALASIHAIAGDHPEFLRMGGVTRHLQKRHREAIDLLRRALKLAPGDALIYTNLGSVLRASGDYDGAIAAFARASELDPDLAAPWYNLGKTLAKQIRVDEALDALDHALRREPDHVGAQIARADLMIAIGRIQEGASGYRRILAKTPQLIRAWGGLTNIKTEQLTDEETATLERLYAAPGISDADRARLGFSLGKTLEDKGRYAEAFSVFCAANAARRRELSWNATQFSRGIDSIIAAFDKPPAHTADPALGREIIFIVSMPRAGSTLTEHILAAHPDVEGADEIPDLGAIIEEESKQRGRAFPDWVAQAGAADWERLGRRYLERTARWRKDSPRSTDKGLINWVFIGAAHAMLPGARFVNCRRDPVETCWSCFKQYFDRGQVYTYDIGELTAQWRDYDRLMRFWHACYPHRVYESVYENLLADPDAEIRRLLDFCELPFAPACLRFDETRRVVRTVSAGQVRQPLRRDTARTPAYGELLAPLRRALGVDLGPATSLSDASA